VVTGAWWPDIDVNTLRDRMNLEGEIPHARLVEAIEWGAIETIDQLATWQAAREEEGFASLITVDPANTVGGKTRLELLFLAAVSSYAAGRLAERHPDLTAGREGSERGDQRRAMADGFTASATRAVRAIQGEARSTSELI